MVKILVPIDFSNNSIIALNYAREIALENNYELVLLYVFTGHTNSYANRIIHIEKIVDPSVKEAEKKLSKLISDIVKESPNLKISPLYKEGILAEVICNETKSNGYELIIMGTKGASGLESVLIGSNTYDVIKDSSIPVLAIPSNSQTVKKDTIALMTNFYASEIEVLKQAIQFFGKNFHLHLVHLSKNDANIESLNKRLCTWIDTIISETGIEDISYTIKKRTYFAKSAASITNNTQTLIRDEDIDIILLTKSHKSFLRKIFSENIIKGMAFNIMIPNFFGKDN